MGGRERERAEVSINDVAGSSPRAASFFEVQLARLHAAGTWAGKKDRFLVSTFFQFLPGSLKKGRMIACWMTASTWGVNLYRITFAGLREKVQLLADSSPAWPLPFFC